MKVALVWNHPSRLLDCSFRHEQVVAGCRALGHDPVVVASAAAAAGFDGPVHPVADLAQLADVELWRRLGAGAAILVTWLRMSDVLAAIGAAGTRIAAIADSDGLLGVRRRPFVHLGRLWATGGDLRGRLRAVRFWLRRCRDEIPGPGPEEREILASARHSDVLAFGDAKAKEGFLAFLADHRAGELERRLELVPWTVAAPFLAVPPAASRPPRLVAVGRWGSAQKDAPLLSRALARHLAGRPGVEPKVEVVVFGEGAETAFAPLAARFPGVRLAGPVAFDAVAATLAASRSIVFASRWEGHPPHAAFEALAAGATVVGPPIPSFASFDGAWGRAARRRSAGGIAAALAAEDAAWQRGDRDPLAIAAHWRSRLEPAAVVRALLAPLEAP